MPFTHENVVKEVSVIGGFTCNKCKKHHDIDDVIETQEMIHIKGIGGYDSKWGDGTQYELTLCQACSVDMFKGIADIKVEE